LFALLVAAPSAFASFPYTHPGATPGDPTDLYLTTQFPSDVDGDRTWQYAASPDSPANAFVNSYPTELGGVRGAHIVDSNPALPTAWQTTTGRPDVAISVMDSGIKWNDDGAMTDLRFKVRLNAGELPTPSNDGLATPNLTGENCLAGTPYSHSGQDDLNGDGVFNLRDFSCDNRVSPNPPLNVNPGMFEPQDLLIAFSGPGAHGDVAGGFDDDHNGYVDDIAGWDFLDNDNDPFDDVQYGHGTGEARDSTAEVDNGGNAGSCPNCMVVPLRVGDSFVADVNRFGAAVTYAVDNGVLVVQSALGTLNNSSLARDAVDYAYDHGVAVVVSAADEAAQHDNQPYLPHTILVNSVTQSPIPAPDQSYLDFNGCTNFNAKITLAIPSTSCSSNAVGIGAGLAGLIVSAAMNARDKGKLASHPTCRLVTDGPDLGTAPDPCAITANEVRQVMATATIGGTSVVDDVDFVGLGGPTGPEPNCGTPPTPPPGCTDPNGAVTTSAVANRGTPIAPPPLFSYPARDGHDQFYGYGRANTNRSVKLLMSDPVTPTVAKIPPEVEISSPTWNEQVNPDQASFQVRGDVYARGDSYTCRVLVAPGHYPDDDEAPDGDFHAVSSPGVCDGSTGHTAPLSGALATVTTSSLKALFPVDTQTSPLTDDFHGRESGATGQTSGGRPDIEAYGFVVKVVATVQRGTPAVPVTGEDRRAAYLHRDQDMLDGYPKAITGGGTIQPQPATPTADGASSPAFADLDGDNRNELILAGSDGFVHALRPDGTELPGWPVRTDPPGFVAQHSASPASPAYAGGEVSTNLGGAVLASVAVGDTNDDGVPEVYAADLEGKIYGWRADGTKVFGVESNPAFSGKPLTPFANVRLGETNRTQHGFIASPVLADLDLDGHDEIVAAAMDRHVYAWHRNGTLVSGFPALVVDQAKVDSIDPVTHRVQFSATAGSEQQGAIVDTPAVGDLDGDADNTGADELPEIVVGTNEEYRAADDGGFNAAAANGSSFDLLTQLQTASDEFKRQCGRPCDPIDVPLSPGNTRIYAINATGDPDGPLTGASPIRPGWPMKPAIAMTGLLPIVGEGVTGSPIIGSVACGGLPAPRVGAVANNGPAYILNQNGASCYGRDPQGKDIPLQTDGYGNQLDHPMLPAVGHPAFIDLGGASPSFAMPAAGIVRALDLAFPEYQKGGQDFLAAWSVEGGGQLRPGFPTTMNDLQFLTGPTGADIDGLPGEELVAGSASKDLEAFNAAGVPASTAWPKVTTDWTVANPLVGSFGTLDVDAGATKVVIGLTRSGYLNAYSTGAPACSPSSWPRFHHDNANSGNYDRDAGLPGRPFEAAVSVGVLTFRAPGDDLLCGAADRYEIVTSQAPIDEGNFGGATALTGAPDPAEAGAENSYKLPDEAKRYVAVRAIDEQGNVGRPAVIDLGPGPGPGGGGPGGGTGTGTGGGTGIGGDGSGGGTGGDGSGGGGDGGGSGGGGAAGHCANLIGGTPGQDKLTGTDGSDRIDAGGGADTIDAAGGDDCVAGQGGDDHLDGAAGADDVRGGRGRDRVTGGTGDDVIHVRRGARDRVDCGPGDDVVFLNDNRDRARNCETVHGTG
jgi:hypothetical protein